MKPGDAFVESAFGSSGQLLYFGTMLRLAYPLPLRECVCVCAYLLPLKEWVCGLLL